MPYMTVGRENSGNIELHYVDQGSGQPIVLIHGYPLSWRAWEKQIPMLIQLGYRVIAYDRRGFGDSSKPFVGYDYDTFTEDLHTLIEGLGLKQFTLMGHSMGGGELARYTARHGAGKVEKLIFLAGVPPCLLKSADNPEGVDASVFDGISKQVAADRPAFFAGFFQQFYNVDHLGGKRISEHDLQADWHTAVHAGPRAALACVDSWGTDFRNDLKQINVPALVIQGDEDRIVPLKSSGQRMPASLKGSRLEVIKGAPHGLAWTHAAEINPHIAEFLGRAAQTTKVA
jgi:pimeloyl-ACP methyl ester carboxylesterase